MEIKAYICPACGGKLEVACDTTFTTCPFCGMKIHISYENGGEIPKNPDLRIFADQRTGMNLAGAVVPKDYILTGTLSDQPQGPGTPFGIMVQAASPDRSVLLVGTSAEMFDDMLNPILKSFSAMAGLKNPFARKFIEPEQYLQEFAQYVVGGPVASVAKAALPSLSAKNYALTRAQIEAEMEQQNNYDPAMPVKIVNVAYDPILMKFTAEADGRKLVVLAGMDYQGCEIASGFSGGFGGFGMNQAMGDAVQSMANGLKNMFGEVKSAIDGGGSESKVKNAFSFFMKGGLLGEAFRNRKAGGQQDQNPDGGMNGQPMQQGQPEQGAGGLYGQQMQTDQPNQSADGLYGQQRSAEGLYGQAQQSQPEQDMNGEPAGQTGQQAQPQQGAGRRPDGSIPLGHAKEYGIRSDETIWGARYRFAMVAPAEQEQEATEVFLKFVGSFALDESQQQRWNQKTAQTIQQALAQNQMMHARSQQLQMGTLQRQQQLSQTLAKNNEMFLEGMRDSAAKRNAMYDHMNQGFSEAIRGVNTYQTTTGGTVEVSAGADHVYQNRYGDVIGVSGNALDNGTAAKLDWTELNQQ